MNKIKNIYYFSLARSDFYITHNLLQKIASETKIKTNLVITGMHYAKQFGNTSKQVKKKNKIKYHFIPINYEKIKFNKFDVLKISSKLISKFTTFIKKNKPDVIMILGDRYEAFILAYCATILKVPIMHLHGGELSYGSYDESFRHSITKMSYWHFVATKNSMQRVSQMGEQRNRIFYIGSLVNDNLKVTKKYNKEFLAKDLKFNLKKKLALLTYHPTTLISNSDDKIIKNIIKFLNEKKYNTVITSPNADPDGLKIKNKIKKFIDGKKRFLFVDNLGSEKYYALIKFADFVIGNSSSGILEAPLIGTPTINIGNRQLGREKSPSIFDSDGSLYSISGCYNKILNLKTKQQNKKLSPYYKENPIKKIIKIIKNLSIPANNVKKFNSF